MTNATHAHTDPLHAALMLVPAITGFLLLLWLMARWLPRKMSGWDALAEKFPANDVHQFGGKFHGCTGYFGKLGGVTVKNGFRIECAQEGLCVTAKFAKRLPILIPWSSVREIQQIDNPFGGVVMIFADYESQVYFTLPKAALVDLQRNVPASRFRPPTSVFQAVKDRLHGRSQ